MSSEEIWCLDEDCKCRMMNPSVSYHWHIAFLGSTSDEFFSVSRLVLGDVVVLKYLTRYFILAKTLHRSRAQQTSICMSR